MSWFYEIRSSTNSVLKRDGGFPTQDAAKAAARLPYGQGREDAKKMKSMRQPDRPDVGRILLGQNLGDLREVGIGDLHQLFGISIRQAAQYSIVQLTFC